TQHRRTDAIEISPAADLSSDGDWVTDLHLLRVCRCGNGKVADRAGERRRRTRWQRFYLQSDGLALHLNVTALSETSKRIDDERIVEQIVAKRIERHGPWQ